MVDNRRRDAFKSEAGERSGDKVARPTDPGLQVKTLSPLESNGDWAVDVSDDIHCLGVSDTHHWLVVHLHQLISYLEKATGLCNGARSDGRYLDIGSVGV